MRQRREWQHFKRHLPSHRQLFGLIDDPHSAASQLTKDAEVTKCLLSLQVDVGTLRLAVGLRFAHNLQQLRQRWRHARIIDNIELQLVLQETSLIQRISGLETLRAQYPDGDTMPEIMYELAVAYLEEGRSAEAGALLEELTARFPKSTFAVGARRRIPLGSVRSRAQSGV